MTDTSHTGPGGAGGLSPDELADRAEALLTKRLPPLELETVLRRPETRLTLSLSPDETDVLAHGFGADRLEDFVFEANLKPEDASRIVLEGRLQARVRQSCVITLEPIERELDARVRRIYQAEGSEPEGDAVDDDDFAFSEDFADLEYLEGGPLNVALAVYEELALNIDPYPRSPSAPEPHSLAHSASDGEVDEDHPFAKLAALKGASTAKTGGDAE